jgi:hypothetical protein
MFEQRPTTEQIPTQAIREVEPTPLLDGTEFDLHQAREDLAKYARVAMRPAGYNETPAPQEVAPLTPQEKIGHNAARMLIVRSDYGLAA